jgi:hypothetical protein
MKHVGKMKNNSARVVVAYRTLPDDPYNCLVVGTQGLGDSYHDSLMSLIEHDAAQEANELADVLASRRFPDGSVMLSYLHINGHLKKVATNTVVMTPDSQTTIPLNELNQIIADQKGIALEDLAVSPEGQKATPKKAAAKKSESSAGSGFELSPAEMRSRADALYKEAAKLRKDADALDPPKSKKKTTAEAE